MASRQASGIARKRTVSRPKEILNRVQDEGRAEACEREARVMLGENSEERQRREERER